jgi:acyl carrier protein
MADQEEIFAKVQETLVDALGVDDDEVTLKSTLQGDLGAESIDFLDISFRLEKNFGIKIPKGELFPDGLTSQEGLVVDGKVTESGIAELKKRLPFCDVDAFAKDPRADKIWDLFTVEMLVKYVASKVG